MGKVRLKEAVENGQNGANSSQTIALRPLHVSGLVLRKADLIEALRVYVPGLYDLQVTEDGEHFWLLLEERGQDEDSTTQ